MLQGKVGLTKRPLLPGSSTHDASSFLCSNSEHACRLALAAVGSNLASVEHVPQHRRRSPVDLIER